MNNDQFRRLLLTPAPKPPGPETSSPSSAAQTRRDVGGNASLGSRLRASIPMTPRNVSVDFSRQLAESRKGSQPAKKFRSIAAPKGTKLPSGYVDRTKLREQEQEEQDDKAERIKSLEELMKLQQIDKETFEKLRDEIVGGDVSTTHLVKGLDWKLLKRVKEGEDVLNKPSEEGPNEEDVEDEFDRLEEKEVVAIAKEKTIKKGELAPPSLVPGRKRTRDEILAEMKAARLAAKEAAQPSLGSRFKRIDQPRSSSRIEIDSKGREVLITTDEEGNVKRKVRKTQQLSKEEDHKGLLMPDETSKPLGMEVPEVPKPIEQEEDEDVNIFDDAGSDYDPLAGLEDQESEEEREDNGVTAKSSEKGKMLPPPVPPSGPRNYFNDKASDTSEEPRRAADQAIFAALKKASTLNPIDHDPENAEEAAREARRKKMLEANDRDAADMDMGFGSSRIADEEDMEDRPIKLAEWKGIGNDDDDEGGHHQGRGGQKRKRGSKKKKGDGNNASDVLKVLERRKQGGA